MRSPKPGVPRAVLDAFGLPHCGQRLSGGEGRSFLHGRVVLKPVEDAAEATWSAHVLTGLEPRGFRLARPVRSGDGRYVVDGWSASEHVDGQAGPVGRWELLLNAARAFHAALAHLPRPAMVDARTHRWAHADRVAWGEEGVDVPVEAADLMARLGRLRHAVNARSQLIHGDLSGNVLFAEGLPPAIIDFSPYWRPVAYAEAIIVVDGLLWYGAGRELVARAASGAEFPQMLVRALIFRLVALTESVHQRHSADLSELHLFTPVIELLEQLSARRQ